jgi:hypothetical protein
MKLRRGSKLEFGTHNPNTQATSTQGKSIIHYNSKSLSTHKLLLYFRYNFIYRRISRLCIRPRKHTTDTNNTGRFIMYYGITKIGYRKTVGHVFTKPVQIEGTTQNMFFPSKLLFLSYFTFLPLVDASVCSDHVDPCWRVCVTKIWISYLCVPCHPWYTHRTPLVVKKNFFSFPAAVNNYYCYKCL